MANLASKCSCKDACLAMDGREFLKLAKVQLLEQIRTDLCCDTAQVRDRVTVHLNSAFVIAGLMYTDGLTGQNLSAIAWPDPFQVPYGSGDFSARPRKICGQLGAT